MNEPVQLVPGAPVPPEYASDPVQAAAHAGDVLIVRLALLQRGGRVFECLAHILAAIDGFLDPEAVGHLVKHGVGEESFKSDVLPLVFGDQQVGKLACYVRPDRFLFI